VLKIAVDVCGFTADAAGADAFEKKLLLPSAAKGWLGAAAGFGGVGLVDTTRKEDSGRPLPGPPADDILFIWL
jgi:hypothetical protein